MTSNAHDVRAKDREREEIRRLLQETGDAPAAGAAARKGATRGGKGDA